jgi:hypothetical protein
MTKTDISRWPRLFAGGGLFFIVAWASGLVAFPLLKGQPIGYVPIACGVALGVSLLQSRPRRWVTERLVRLTDTQFLFGAVALAIALRLLAIAVFPVEPRVDDAEFHKYAENMLHGAGYGSPGHRAWFPPGMSFALFAVYWMTTPSPWAGKLLQVALGGMLVWQTWALARRIVPATSARIATLLVAGLPTLVFYTSTLGYEILLALVLVLTWRLALMVHRADRATSAALGLAATGLLLGYGSLVKPICLLVAPLVGLAWWAMGDGVWRAGSRVVPILTVMAIVIAPWTLRNYRVLGAFVPISTNGGTTLYAANNPKADGLATLVDPLPGEQDEVSRDRLRLHAALVWIASHPVRSIELAAIKVAYTWGTTSSVMAVVSADRLPPAAEDLSKAALNVSWGVLFVWAAVGVVRRGAWTRVRLLPGVLMLAYVFVLHLFYEANSRHHVPVLPVLCVIASLAWSAPAREPAAPPE